EGRRQQLLGVENSCALTRRFVRAGIDVVLADVLTPETIEVYRADVDGLMIVGLRITAAEARRRAAGRPLHLTPAEFERLHAEEGRYSLGYDQIVDVDHCDLSSQLELVRRLWT